MKSSVHWILSIFHKFGIWGNWICSLLLYSQLIETVEWEILYFDQYFDLSIRHYQYIVYKIRVVELLKNQIGDPQVNEWILGWRDDLNRRCLKSKIEDWRLGLAQSFTFFRFNFWSEVTQLQLISSVIFKI